MDPRKISRPGIAALLCLLLMQTACRLQVQRVDGVTIQGRRELHIVNPKVVLPPLPPDTPIRISMPKDSLSLEDHTLVAYYRHGYSPLVACSYHEVLDEIAKQARSLGARYIKVTNIQPPDDKGSCFRMEALFYK